MTRELVSVRRARKDGSGFEDSVVTSSRQIYKGRVMYVFTVVGRRTQPL